MKKKLLVSASLFHGMTDAAAIIPSMIFPILFNQGFLIKNYAQIGLISNLGLLTTLAMQFLVVRLSCRYESRTLLLLSGCAISLSLAAMPFVTTFAGLLLAFLFLRIATSFYHPIIVAWICKTLSGKGKELDDAMGIQSGSGNVGAILAYLTVGIMAQRWTWKTPLWAWSTLGLLIGTTVMIILRGVSSKGGKIPSLSAGSWMKSLAGIKRYIPGFFFGGMGWSVTVYYAPLLLNHKFGVPIGRTGFALALWIGMGTITGYGYGIWSRRFGRKKSLSP